MNCQRFKPAEFKYVTPVGAQKEKITKGVPQVDLDILEVSETFHAPPANAVSYEVLSNYPPDNTPVPDRVPKFYSSFQSGDVKPSNYVCKYQELTDVTTRSKRPVESVKYPGQRLLG
tara:strand:+ start:918 stop:1268 length:351 start_codon:yes stop_codon:yes gene_type:complete